MTTEQEEAGIRAVKHVIGEWFPDCASALVLYMHDKPQPGWHVMWRGTKAETMQMATQLWMSAVGHGPGAEDPQAPASE